MNKRFCLTLVTMLIGIASAAQPFELGVSTGTSLNGTSQIDTGIDIAYIFTITPDLELGLGVGLRYARPLYETITTHIISNGDDGIVEDIRVEKEYLNETSIPLFGIIRYSTAHNLFFQADAGYRFPIFSTIGFFPIPESASGVFFAPQIGYKLSSKRTVSIGFLHQCGKHTERLNSYNSIASHEVFINDLYNVVRPTAIVRYTKSL